MTVAILGIGTELTRGDIANTNGAWLAKEMTARGFEVTAIDMVDDDRARIIDALRRLANNHSLVICTGGLGPTTDDITTECVARILDVELELDEPSLAAIETRMARFGHKMTESNRKQAYFPKGATILPNDWGTAPAFRVTFGSATVFFTPGVPTEMKAIFEERIVPSLGIPRDRTPYEIVFRTFGAGESALNDRLSGIETEFGVTIGYRVHFPEVDIKILARDTDLESAKARANRTASVVRERLSDCIYGEGKTYLPLVLGAHFEALNQRFAVAESCTGGLVSQLITEQPGVSSWFAGSVVSYANDVKTGVLNVEPETITRHGAVSTEVAQSMVEGICSVMRCSYGLAITGVAGPTGGTEGKPVGTVVFAINGPRGIITMRKQFSGERARVQRVAAYFGLKLVLDYLRAKV